MLKTKTITTDKATVLLVELPEGAKHIRVETNQAVIPYGKMVHYETPPTKESYGLENTEGFDLPKGNWQLIGRLPDITEEQLSEVVDSDIRYCWNCQGGSCMVCCGYGEIIVETSLEVLSSLLQANEVYFENKKPWEKDVLQRIIGNMLDKESQSKVWDKERTYLFIKVD